MDQDSWREASLKSLSDSVKVDRYKGDLEHAERLRAGLKKSKSKRKESQAAADIDLGMRGLDQAEQYRDNGDLHAAKELYEKSLGLLIQHLQDPEVTSVGKETLQARVEIAFQDAESIKQQIEEQGQSSSRPVLESAYQTLSAALSSALGRVTGSPTKATTTPLASREPIRQNSVKKQTSQKRIVTTTVKPVSPRRTINNAPSRTNQRPTATRRSPRAAATKPKQAPSPAAGDASDETRKVVLSDFLVDRSQVESTSWDDIAGLSQAKQSLQETAILPLIRPDLFTGLRKPQNVLLYGPPGTGKTMMVRAVAGESGSNLFAVTASVLTSKWMGDSEKLIRTLFQVAREAAPSIIFIDEMDSLLSARKSDGEHEASRRLKTEFMVQTDGMTKEGNGVLVLACTNCPWDVDSAVMRRFPRRIYIPLPDADARKALVKSLLKKAKKHSLKAPEVGKLVSRTKGFSGSDISSIASEAAFGPLRALGGLDAIRNARAKDVRPISYDDFDAVIKLTTKSISDEQLKKYDNWLTSQQA